MAVLGLGGRGVPCALPGILTYMALGPAYGSLLGDHLALLLETSNPLEEHLGYLGEAHLMQILPNRREAHLAKMAL